METPIIEDPNSPQMTAMIKSMLLDQKREERQRRLPELSPPEVEPSPAQPDKATDGKLTKLDVSKLVPSMPALRPKRTTMFDDDVPVQQPIELDGEDELLSQDPLMAEPEDIITPEDIAEVIEEDRKARDRPKKDYGPMIKAHVATLKSHAGKIWTHARKIKAKHVFLTFAALIVILRPWLVLGVTVTLLMVFAITYLSLGHERFTEILLARWLRFKKRNPQKAEQYFTKATQLVEQYNAKVARLPKALAERLTLPDLAELEKEDDRPDPFDRLAEQAQDI
ncbi:MAG: hypothetical protein AAFN80_14280 [Pseudomonadota bacterium]